MHTVTENAEAVFRDCVSEIRDEIRRYYDTVNRLEVELKADGRIDGEMLFKVKVCVNYEPDVEAIDISDAIREALRRHCYKKESNPLLITHTPKPTAENDNDAS